MATKRELKREIITLRNRVDALAARVAALEGGKIQAVRSGASHIDDNGVVQYWDSPVVTWVRA